MSKTTTRAARKAPAPVALPEPESQVMPVAPTVATPAKPAKRSMKGINASGNRPWSKKLYAIGTAYATPEGQAKVKTMAGQVQGILRYVATQERPARGGELCRGAIDGGFVVTRIAPDVLFAYYRKAMEDAGLLKFVGYTA